VALPEVLLIEPHVYRDERGSFAEYWRANSYGELGISDTFVQDNVSWSKRDVLRGLHFQWPRAQAKLITPLQGTIFDVAVDVRPGSPTFGRWVGAQLSSAGLQQLYIPAGFAHGFVVTSDIAVVSYRCSDYYAPEHERSIRWDDAQIGISWPVQNPILSVRDAQAPTLSQLVSTNAFFVDAY
jgi:dTDP-4-dehydrorhamnose 3,5-epimerase